MTPTKTRVRKSPSLTEAQQRAYRVFRGKLEEVSDDYAATVATIQRLREEQRIENCPSDGKIADLKRGNRQLLLNSVPALQLHRRRLEQTFGVPRVFLTEAINAEAAVFPPETIKTLLS